MSELLKVGEFAAGAKIQVSTVRAWILHRKIAYVRLGGRAVRIPKSELERLIHEDTIPAREAR
jgi:excisionase family DNA binding protein